MPSSEQRLRVVGACLIGAAVLFWVSWLLMPGVGVTDAAQILTLVGPHRHRVAVSAAVQLFSAVLYVPALLGVVALPPLGGRPGIRRGAGVLLVGAMGSAADAVFHLLAFAMTAPGLAPEPLVPVMRFMQGPGLLMVAPLIVAFFVGSVWLSVALTRADVVPGWHPWLYGVALAVVAGGAALASAGVIAPRTVGLSMLAVISAAQCHLGIGLLQRE